MSERKWTPGEWTEFNWGKNAGVTSMHDDTDIAICSGLDGQRSYEQAIANAYLIAAAPDLYDAVQAMVDYCNAECGSNIYPGHQANQALAKARGETQ